MHIERISTRVLALPVERPYRLSLGVLIESIGHVLVEAYSNEGHVGTAYAYSLYGQLPALRAAIDELKELAIGKDPFAVKTIWRNMMAYSGWFGPGGFLHLAISGIDVALWDLLGRVTGRPLHLLLGGDRERVPCYHLGFWRSTSASELSKEADDCRRRGFKAVKMKLGGEAHLEGELQRVKAVREALGNDVALMVDPNQAWSPDTTLQMGRRLQEYNIYWIEDPVPYDDMEGRARVVAGLDIPIASGEEQYTKAGFQNLVEHKAADIFNIDLQRVGGITGWLGIASFLEARNLVFTSHGLPEVQCHLIASTEKGLTVEYSPRSFGLLKQPPKLVEGLIEMPKEPGIGLNIDEEVVKRYELK